MIFSENLLIDTLSNKIAEPSLHWGAVYQADTKRPSSSMSTLFIDLPAFRVEAIK